MGALIATLIWTITLAALSLTPLRDTLPGLSQTDPCPRFTSEEFGRRYPPIRIRSDEIYVVGSVSRPGAVKYKAGLTLTQAIESAGGLLADANQTLRVHKVRKGEPKHEAVKLNLKAVARKQLPDMVLEGGYIIEAESRCLLPAPQPQLYWDAPPTPIKNPSARQRVSASM